MNPVFFLALGGLALWLVFSGNGRAAAVLQAIRLGNTAPQGSQPGGPNGAPPFAGPPGAQPGGGGGGGFDDMIGPYQAGPNWLPSVDTSPANPGYQPGPQDSPAPQSYEPWRVF